MGFSPAQFVPALSKKTFQFIGAAGAAPLAIVQEAGAQDVELAVAAAEVCGLFLERSIPLRILSVHLVTFFRLRGQLGRINQRMTVRSVFKSGEYVWTLVNQADRRLTGSVIQALIVEHASELAQLDALSMGKPPSLATFEMYDCKSALDHFA